MRIEVPFVCDLIVNRFKERERERDGESNSQLGKANQLIRIVLRRVITMP
jgi:hypothetical protein